MTNNEYDNEQTTTMNSNTNHKTTTTFNHEMAAARENPSDEKFLGLVNKRYVKSLHGIIHGVTSTKALIMGNLVFVHRVILGHQGSDYSAIERCFHRCNLVAALTTAIFFWNHVQSWQLSTTSMKEKGFTPKIMQRFNQGRGVVSMILFSLAPFLFAYLPQTALESHIGSTGVALALIAGSAFVYDLVKDYGKLMFMLYGMTPMALGLSILCCSSEGTLASLDADYPLAMDVFRKEASMCVICVQMGFLLYYLYSRNKVTKETIQTVCKVYHVSLSIIFMVRVERDLWLQWKNNDTLPWPMMVKPVLLNLAMGAMLLKKPLSEVSMGDAKTQQAAPVEPIQSFAVQKKDEDQPAPTSSSTDEHEDDVIGMTITPGLRQRRISRLRSTRIESVCQ